MKLKINDTEYWVKDDIKLPSNFESINDYKKRYYIYKNNLVHREDGPATTYPSGTKEWFLNGLRHRLDGPAIIYFNGLKSWYLNDISVDGEIYEKIQNSSKEELLVYMIQDKYKDYISLIEYRLSL